MGRPQFIGASDLAEQFGMTSRYWIRMAAEGKIPGAWQPSGDRGKWLFDQDAVSRWYRSQRKEVSAWPGFTKEVRRIGDAPSVPGRNSGAPSAPRIEQLLKSVCKSG